MKTTTQYGATVLLLTLPVLAACSDSPVPVGPTDLKASASMAAAASSPPIPVSGSAVLFATTAVVHSEVPTGTGMIQRSTAVVKLSGDVSGWILFHPTSVFDFVNGTLVNTGTQIFAGTIAGSEPVVLHDDEFRFDIDLATGATTGEIFLSRSNDAPHKGGWYECRLAMVGTGVTPEGDLTSDYSGTCTRRGNVG
jgi:hypothetical protein